MSYLYISCRFHCSQVDSDTRNHSPSRYKMPMDCSRAHQFHTRPLVGAAGPHTLSHPRWIPHDTDTQMIPVCWCSRPMDRSCLDPLRTRSNLEWEQKQLSQLIIQQGNIQIANNKAIANIMQGKPYKTKRTKPHPIKISRLHQGDCKPRTEFYMWPVPVHICPVPVKPFTHMHWKEPTVLIQRALASQFPGSSKHSLISGTNMQAYLL